MVQKERTFLPLLDQSLLYSRSRPIEELVLPPQTPGTPLERQVAMRHMHVARILHAEHTEDKKERRRAISNVFRDLYAAEVDRDEFTDIVGQASLASALLSARWQGLSVRRPSLADEATYRVQFIAEMQANNKQGYICPIRSRGNRKIEYTHAREEDGILTIDVPVMDIPWIDNRPERPLPMFPPLPQTAKEIQDTVRWYMGKLGHPSHRGFGMPVSVQ